MTASCVAITVARLASIASSQSAKKLSGSSATPSRDNNSYTTIFRTPRTSDRSRCYWLTDQAAETHRRAGSGSPPAGRRFLLLSLTDGRHGGTGAANCPPEGGMFPEGGMLLRSFRMCAYLVI